MTTRSHAQARYIQAAIILCGCCFVAVLMSVGGAAQPRPERKASNLQVLDSTISHDELIDQMGKFADALGVGCDFCHAPGKDPTSREMDFASDAKKEKLVARSMMRMTRDINGSYLAKINELESPRVTVECVTCHHGQPEPIQLANLLSKTLTDKGIVAVDSIYRELRTNYYGSAAYDFSDRVLIHLAYDISEENSKDAMSLLKLNQEFNPKSSLNEWAMGQLYLQTGDTTQAIAGYRRALQIDPNNRRAKRGLDALGAKPE